MLRGDIALTDRVGEYGRIREELEHLDGLYVKVGFPQESKPGLPDSPKGKPATEMSEVATIAAFHEFGTARIPERPFFRQALDGNREALKEFIDNQYSKVMQGKQSTNDGLERVGQFLSSKIKGSIRSGNFEPLAKSTIDSKGSTKPLIDTGQMINSVTYVVVRE
jgi:hypothetical protein